MKEYVSTTNNDLNNKEIRKDNNRKPQNFITRNTDNGNCAQNQPMPRPEHGCRTSEKTHTVYCQAQNLRVDNSKIQKGSATGGEELESVMGQEEIVEFPIYSKGAFSTPTPLDIPKNLNLDKAYYLKDVLDATVTTTETCAETRSNPTLFITRYEYVNLYHQMTDWFNAFLMLPMDARGAKIDVVLLDAHPKGNLDSVWSRLFGGTVEYVKHLREGGVCFENAIFVPPGYSSMIYVTNSLSSNEMSMCKGLMKDFVSFVIQSYNLQSVKMIPRRIVIIDRVSYIAHPRSIINSKSRERSISNLNKLEKRLNKMPGVTATLVQLETMDIGDQIRLIREAELLIGNHGAGLSHLLFLHDNANVMEFRDHNGHYTQWADWKGIPHHSIYTEYKTSLTNSLVRNNIIPKIESMFKMESSSPK